MPGQRSPFQVELTKPERAKLEEIVRRRTEHADNVERARIILKCASGESVSGIAKQMELDRMTVRKWVKRFVLKRLEGLEDLPRSGRPPDFSPCRRTARGENRVRTP